MLTIHQKVIGKKELVVVPRKEYEEYSFWKKAVRVRIDEAWFWTPEWQKKEAEADEAIKRKKISRQFTKHRTLIASLKRK